MEIRAPKDPVKKRQSFYIMLDKEVSAGVQPDGRGIQFLYLNDGRMIDSAKLVGNVTDEEMLALLATTEGFRKLVHSIGVSLVATDTDKARFVFQMYGKKSIYDSGTTLSCELPSNGEEQIIELGSVKWSDDDDIPGQARFEFDRPGILAVICVKLYLNDGYTAPAMEPEVPVNTASTEYKEMIEQSLLNVGNSFRIRKAIEKAEHGDEVTIAYIGGSITQGAGAAPINKECYAYKSYLEFKRRFETCNNVKYIKAGVGGTPSELGMIRYKRDVLRDGRVKPDIVIIEFAVNDNDDETKGVCYESLVRRILMSENEPAVVLLFAVFSDDSNLQERLIPIGRLYDLPMVSVKNAVTEQFYRTASTGRVLTKHQYFYDKYHPTNMGHTIMADCLIHLLDMTESCKDDAPMDYSNIAPVLGSDFENVRLLDRIRSYTGAKIECGAFSSTDTELQSVEMDENTVPTPMFSDNWKHLADGGSDAFIMKIRSRSLLLVFKDSASAGVGCADCLVDGELRLTANPHINNWTHCNAVILYNERETAEHTVEIRMSADSEDKEFTILGFGYVE